MIYKVLIFTRLLIFLLVSMTLTAMEQDLLVSIQKSDRTKFLRIIQAPGFDLDRVYDIQGNRPLHLAAQKMYVEGVEDLLFLGATVNVYNNDNKTPLHIVLHPKVMKSDRANRIAELLLASGAFIQEPPRSLGTSVHDHPCIEKNVYGFMIDLLRIGNVGMFNDVLDQGADPNHFLISSPCNLGNPVTHENQPPTLLNIATFFHNDEAVCMLLDAGADPAKDSFIGKEISGFENNRYVPYISTPICVLALTESPDVSGEMAQLLYTHVPKFRIRNEWNITALALLCCFKRLNIPRFVRDMQYMLCQYVVRENVLVKQLSVAKKMCGQAERYKQYNLENFEVLTESSFVIYYPVWVKHINQSLPQSTRTYLTTLS